MNQHLLSTAGEQFINCIFAVILFSFPLIQDGPQDKDSQSIRIEGAIVKIIDSAKIPAELPGVLLELSYREGQTVQKGDLLAKIKSSDLSLEHRRAKAKHRIAVAKSENQIDIQFAKKSAEVSSAKLARSLSSNQRAPGVVSRGRLQELELETHRDKLRIEQATKNLEVAKMEMDLTQADIELSENAMAKANILSPIGGVVVLVEKNPGEWVEPGDTVLKVVRLDRLKLEGFVTVSQAGKIKIGDSAKVFFEQDSMTATEVNGKVTFINPEANPVNSQVEVWVEIDNRDGSLMPGLEASIIVECSTSKS